ncbi:MAG: type II toxin-antitoxin system Phd/YefM family antitoxin [Oscillospiraceae bacterium]|jgi:antitoxin YefM|nr:type II toxin-antitoxin system Phd/YefM family antitoxin [Oscillospiraceae bacterium]
MLAANYSTVRTRFKEYLDQVTEGNETVIITRKNEKNAVIISMEDYNAMAKARRNAEYEAMLEESRAQLRAGRVTTVDLDFSDLEGEDLSDEAFGV